MSKKKIAWLAAGILGTSVLATSAQFYKKAQEEHKKADLLQQVRQFFAEKGAIATVYIFENASTPDYLTGGVVMEEGPIYTFENDGGNIRFEEESHA